QGVGGLTDVREADVTESGSYDVTLADLEFPSRFSNLAVAVTRGTQRVGSIIGGGKFSFDATPGRYLLNFIAGPGPENIGTYGLSVAVSPPMPTVTLTANPTRVRSGSTTTLTWSSTDATTCTASGDWSGTKATSGTETSAALTAGSTFKLSCQGPGGSTEQQASVTISAQSSGGGGGAADATLLLTLALAWMFLCRGADAMNGRRRRT
ncbi:MAG TPA: hypothetical protein VKB41_15590, partial [Steroidobacteraceae bacterium]|nr:hypothetical protein [Steroidobacteraceae bacterium]